MKSKTPKAYELMLDRDIDIPWEIARFLAPTKKILLSSEQAAISNEGDFGSISDMRKVVDYLAYQFGGKVSWTKHNL